MAKPEGGDFRDRVTMFRDVIFVVLGLGVIIYAAGAILSRIGSVVIVLIMAIVFEVTLSPLVDRLALHWRRPWAVATVVAGAVVILGVGGSLLVTVMSGQVAALVGHLPKEIKTLIRVTPGLVNGVHHLGLPIDLASLQDRFLASVGQISTIIVSRTFNIVATLINGLVDAAITVFITVYLLLDAERIQLAVLRLVPNQHRELLLAVEHTLTRVIGGYVRGQLTLSLLVGGGFGLGCWAIGLPYPLVLGLFAAIMELIPLLGPILGAVIPFILALFLHPLVQVPELIGLLALVHLLESQILGPRIMRSQVGLHPVLAVLALMIGAELKGIWGALFAVPAAGIVVAAWVAGVRVWRERVVLPSQKPRITK